MKLIFFVTFGTMSIQLFATHGLLEDSRNGGEAKVQRQAKEVDVDVRRTKGGIEFRRVNTEDLVKFGVKDTKKFGEAWREPDSKEKNGVIWGDMAKDEHGKIIFMNQEKAMDYCKKMGAELPRLEDFIRLSELLGSQPGTVQTTKGGVFSGYSPQILPNLVYEKRGGSDFWSSTEHPRQDEFPRDDRVGRYVYTFPGAWGYIIALTGRNYEGCATRCIVRVRR